MLFCRSLGHGGVGASPGSTLHAYPITRQARCQALAALLLARRDTIERTGRTRAPVPLDRAPQARAGGGRAAPAPAQESARRQSGDGRRPKGAASGHAAAGPGEPAAQRTTGPPERERRTKTRSPVPAAADTHPARAHCARAIEAAHCAAGASAARERERQKGRHQRPPPSPAPWRSRHQEPPATAPVPGDVGACQPPSAPAERRRSGEQPRRAEGFARSENLRRSGWQQRRCRQLVYLI